MALLGLAADEATVRRYTYGAGDAALEAEAAALRRALRGPQTVADAPACLQLSLDATKVPLVGGDWTDVKLAALGVVVPGSPDEDGQPTVRTERVSYVARWEPAARFGETITLEAQRRGVDEAAVVVSPNDGAEWIQGNLDLVAPQAVRILDFPHAIEHLGAVAALVYGEGRTEATAWVATQRRALRARGAAPLLAALAACQARGPCASARPDAEGRSPEELLAREGAYFARRAAQLDYPTFRRRGWPVGSGCVESGHKVVTGARLKLAGQHWAADHLNPLLVLRVAACNERWAEAWPVTWAAWRQRERERRAATRQQRRPARPAPSPAPAPAVAPPTPPVPPAPPSKLVVAGRPTVAHPWRKPFLPRRSA